jgi:formylmethanofuran dehydrogenase subunit D
MQVNWYIEGTPLSVSTAKLRKGGYPFLPRGVWSNCIFASDLP